MSGELSFEDKGKVRPKPSQEQAEPKKDERPLTKSDIDGKLDASTLTRMQQTIGNAAVQRFLAQRSGEGETELDDETASAINAKRGGGQALDKNIADKAGGVMGQDFGSVQVHTDSSADQLSRQLGAKAFTTGSDIFFREGAYNPGSSEGQQLISHELTHVVQQGASPPSVQGKMTVNDPNDQFESEADSVAETVMNQPDEAAVQRQMPEEEAEPAEPTEEEGEEAAMAKLDDAVQRATPEEEETAMEKREEGIQRQDDEEER